MLTDRAPEHARLILSFTDIAALLMVATSERWQPLLYDEPYTRVASYEQKIHVQRAARSVPSRVPNMLRLLPCQRPASPEMKLSPSDTIAVVVEPGPASDGCAGETAAASSATATATANAGRTLMCLLTNVHAVRITMSPSTSSGFLSGLASKLRLDPRVVKTRAPPRS